MGEICLHMFLKLSSVAVVFIGAISLQAQTLDTGHLPVTLGLKAGIPVTTMFSSGLPGSGVLLAGTDLSSYSTFVTTTSYSSSTPRYEFGVSAEFHMPFHLRFEVDGLYKRGGFDSNVPSLLSGSLAGQPGYVRTSFNQWEIPGVFKYNISLGHFRPFVDFGASYRHISTITERTYVAGAQTVYNDNSSALRNRNSFGGVAGFGITFKKGPFELTPEARYTRWANESFAANGLKSNKDQGDVLLGINF